MDLATSRWGCRCLQIWRNTQLSLKQLKGCDGLIEINGLLVVWQIGRNPPEWLFGRLAEGQFKVLKENQSILGTQIHLFGNCIE